MLHKILKLEGAKLLTKNALKQVHGGTGCQCVGYPNGVGNEQGSSEGSQCQPC